MPFYIYISKCVGWLKQILTVIVSVTSGSCWIAVIVFVAYGCHMIILSVPQIHSMKRRFGSKLFATSSRGENGAIGGRSSRAECILRQASFRSEERRVGKECRSR